LHKPLYVQIQEYIAERISKGELNPESRIPSERELSQELGVSRMTVRRSLTELVNEGLLERRHGAGTFVAKPKVTYAAAELINYARALRSRGLVVARQLLEFSEVPASRRLSERLKVEIGHSLYHVVLLYLANRVPVVLERTFLSCERCPDLQEYDLERTSIYDLLIEGLQMRLSSTDQAVEAVIASGTAALQLRVEEGFPLLMVTRTLNRSEDELPVQFSQDLLRGDYARVQSRLSLAEGSVQSGSGGRFARMGNSDGPGTAAMRNDKDMVDTSQAERIGSS
jgi:GntR family transcriptional regulator